jgi:eukaryotic-like serine/threonine-protein kinase
LREKLHSERRLSPGRVLTILEDVCAAVSAAHRGNIIHRDLKPDNIFLVATESGDTVKVLHFGLAKLVCNSTSQSTTETRSDAIVGTLRYMSPEQRTGHAANRSWDLWALSVITYELLTGFHPFEDHHNWFLAGVVAPFTPVTKRMPQAAPGWQLLFSRTFALEVSDRYDSVEAFLAELRSAAVE